MCPGWWKQSFRLRLWSLVWFQVRATSCHLTSSKLAWKSTPKCTWMCWRVWWSPNAIGEGGGEMAGPGCGSRTQRRPTSPKRLRLGFRRSATTLYTSLTAPLLPRPESAGLLRLVIRREHHQHGHPQHQSQLDRRHPPDIPRAPAGACRKGMLPVPDPYRGGDWGWRPLYSNRIYLIYIYLTEIARIYSHIFICTCTYVYDCVCMRAWTRKERSYGKSNWEVFARSIMKPLIISQKHSNWIFCSNIVEFYSNLIYIYIYIYIYML